LYPVRSRAVMRRLVNDAIHHRIAHVYIRRSHVNLGAQHARTIGKLALPHPLEQVKVFFDRAIAIRAFLARLGERATILADFICAQVIYVSLALFDQLDGEFVQLIKIVRSIKFAVFPVKAQPANILFDGLDVFDILFGRIGVVKAQIALAAEFKCQAKVQAHGFGVSDVQIAIRLRRPARVNPSAKPTRPDVLNDGIAYKVGGSFGIFLSHIRNHTRATTQPDGRAHCIARTSCPSALFGS